jgi:FtsH-binding integral membrane protein
MDFLNFIKEELLYLIAVLWILGAFLKRSPKVADWLIVWILLAVSILFCFALLGLTAQAAAQAVLITGAAVLGNQLVKQTTNKV